MNCLAMPHSNKGGFYNQVIVFKTSWWISQLKENLLCIIDAEYFNLNIIFPTTQAFQVYFNF